MIAWMLRTVLATAALAGAAALADALVRRAGLPRRPVWAVALAVAAALPLLAALLPATSSGGALALPPEAWSALTRGGGPVVRPARAFPATLLLQAGWLLASGALLGMLAYAGWRLGRLCATWPTVRVEGDEVVLSTGAGPLVVGLVRPRLVVPAWVISAPDSERRMVLAHEREHVRAGDARLLAAAALVSALAPWNLPAWWLVRRLREAVETDCDRRVLAGGFAPADYGRLLLNTAAGVRFGLVPGAALAEPKRLLERRLIAMTHTVSDRRVRRLLPLALGASALLIVACEVARPDAGAPASPVAPKASASATDSSRAMQFANTVAGIGATSMTAHLYTDTILMRQRGHPEEGLTEVTVRRIGPDQMEVSTTDAQGHTQVRHVRVDPRGATDLGPETREVRAIDGEQAFLQQGHALAEAASPEAALELQAVRRARQAEVGPSQQKVAPSVEVDGEPMPASVLKTLDPTRIQSINVLKGPAAAAHTGKDDGRPVIQITTKK